jgi:hypothetical protein
LRDLPELKSQVMIGSYAMSEILLCSHVPMERFFDGTDQENSKNTRRKEWRKAKEENFLYAEVPILILVCFPSVGTALMQPSLRRTRSYGNLPYNKIPYQHRGQNWSAWKADYCLVQRAQISAVVMGPSFMFLNFPRTNLWGLWQKYVIIVFFKSIDKPTSQILDRTA